MTKKRKLHMLSMQMEIESMRKRVLLQHFFEKVFGGHNVENS